MDLKQLCLEVNKLAKEVGSFIKNQTISSDDIETKSKNSLVTFVDKTAEEKIVKRLSELIPEAGFIAEEDTSSKVGKIFNWIVDPLDGTTNFIHSVPCFCVSIALKKADKIILGVIYEINLDELFYAWEGSKSYLNGREISVSNTDKLKNSLLATGFPYANYKRLEDYMELFKDFMKTTRGVRRLGSAAADMAYVACGRYDGFYEYSLNAWDIAAGVIIVKQAGGKVSDFKGGKNYLFGEEMIASNNNIYNEFLIKVTHYFGK